MNNINKECALESVKILSFDQPAKIKSTSEHNNENMSDSSVAGTYVPNMSDDDLAKWRAKYVGGKMKE